MSYDYNNIGEDLVIIFNGGALETLGDWCSDGGMER